MSTTTISMDKVIAIDTTIARICGWTHIENANTMVVGGIWHGYPPDGQLIGQKEKMPAYYSDLSTRPEMLFALSKACHQRAFVNALAGPGTPSYRAQDVWRAMNCTQPEFCRAFLKAFKADPALWS